MDSVTWLRPEYRGREAELINLAAAADLVGVSRSTVSNWAKRHPDFPKVALLTGIGKRRNKYVPKDEFLIWARAQLDKKRSDRRPGPRRPSAVLLSDQLAHHQRQIARLSELEVRQATALKKTRAALHKHRAALQQAGERLTAEITAVHNIERTTPTAKDMS
ncbi:helix-turn-helix domain-containing protein [Streptomyces noursei]|uniref:helix-turn-helix domain-containing protein n=1 Tax=Streptomyces noursei TaxID=1971 RepID=UPI001673CBFC|nr:helix-turn-helix domain-containing protein [Streptomyces noursei]MCZ1019721.1 helix-turn-helix domain-containing protein [Streptomyces noursei]GGX51035.1 hypothetical protein GCM10010341_85780 [Streptomyces noursei]